VEVAKKFFLDDYKWVGEGGGVFGSLVYEGKLGSATYVLEKIDTFFADCVENNYQPQIYYTGHGASGGDWCFPEKKSRIRFDDILELVEKHGGPCWCTILYCDCCFSGAWVKRADGLGQISVQSACGEDEYAYDGVFSAAKFKHDARARAKVAGSGGSSVRWGMKEANPIEWWV